MGADPGPLTQEDQEDPSPRDMANSTASVFDSATEPSNAGAFTEGHTATSASMSK